MVWEDWPVPDPGPGEVRLKHTAVGVNFAEFYHRGGISHPYLGLAQCEPAQGEPNRREPVRSEPSVREPDRRKSVRCKPGQRQPDRRNMD